MSFEGARTPERQTFEGRFATLEPLDAGRHASDLSLADRSGDESTWSFLPYGPWPDAGAHRDWLERRQANSDPMFWTVLVGENALGVISQMSIVPEHGRIEIGHVWFSAPLQRTGAATEAIYLLASYAFDVLGNRRLEWKTDARNTASRRSAERLGFTFEGVFRQHQWVKGANRDTAWFAITDGEWPAVRGAFQAWLDPANFDEQGNQQTPLAELRTPDA